MEFNEIEYKKPIYHIKAPLREHLKKYGKHQKLPLTYEDLLRYKELIPVLDKDGNDTLWRSVMYDVQETKEIHDYLVDIYEMLVAEGDEIPSLMIAAVDYCTFGNSKPFRIKVVNELNDNHDYYYVKRADSSRVYGLELEDIFSPDRVYYLVDQTTLVEDHVVGVPCDVFIDVNVGVKVENRLRLAKEFVKFNERCFTRLLGDMRAYNFVVEITRDFDNVQYRLRAMDFDQQSYEGRMNIYKPQFYKDNIELVKLAQELMTAKTADQYARQERVAMKKRFLYSRMRTRSLLNKMKNDQISSRSNINTLRKDLAAFHKNDEFLKMTRMGQILTRHIELQLGVQINPVSKTPAQ